MQRRFARAVLRALSVLGAGVTIAASVAVSAPAATAAPDTPSVLAKSVQDVTHPGADPVGHGDTLNWVLGYTDNAGSGPATVTDPVDAAGTGQTYVPGSLTVPPGWTPSYSTDGTTFVGTDPGAGTVAVRATDPDSQPGGTNLADLLLAPVNPTATATGGDGYTPIIYRAPSGEVQAWNMFHHQVPTAPKVVCSDLSTGAPCAGGPWPRPVNTTPGPLGSGATGDIGSTLTPQYVQDPARPGTVYYAAITASSVGVGCLDLAAQADCGYVPLETVANGTLSGFVQQGGDIYGVGIDGRTLCMTLATQQPCAGEPYAPVVPGNRANANNFQGSLAVVSGRVFISSTTLNGNTPVLGCFDPATTSACAGWPAPKAVGTVVNAATYDAYPAYDTAGDETGVCSTTTSAQTTCYGVDGSGLTAPTVFNGLGSQLVFNPETIRAPGGDLKSYFGFWITTVSGATVCYDWTTAAPCAGFPLPDPHPNVNGGATRDYGLE
jgi:hypothetical protein